MINIETLSDMELDLLHAQYEKLTATRRAPYHTGHANASSPVTD
jgi:hypothetical protein